MSNSLENLKIGDTLGRLVGSYRCWTQKMTITGQTPKYWLCEESERSVRKVRKSDGRIQGVDSDSCNWAFHVSEEDIAKEKRTKYLQNRIHIAKSFLDKFYERTENLDKLETVNTALEKVLDLVS